MRCSAIINSLGPQRWNAGLGLPLRDLVTAARTIAEDFNEKESVRNADVVKDTNDHGFDYKWLENEVRF